MNESNLSDQALAELLSLTMKVNQWGANVYRNQQGQLHRVHGPAIIYPDGDEFWYHLGQKHRTDGPAIIYAEGSMYWYLYDQAFTEEEFNERIKLV